MKLTDRDYGIADLLAKTACEINKSRYATELLKIIQQLWRLRDAGELEDARVDKIGSVIRQYVDIYAEYEEKICKVHDKETSSNNEMMYKIFGGN
jgi:uncharacterized pyridoxal phosphate-containing UPF0001 family protein